MPIHWTGREKTGPDEIPIADTGDDRVLLGCGFTLAQVTALKDGTVPPEVQQFFQYAWEVLNGQHPLPKK